ncbi:hypothetical protein NQD34_002898 [Periophthalmus magnuspinnatus]|nr:hypothetical protein NQD34_002898 [Periophthalmus magnuspinnatus]
MSSTSERSSEETFLCSICLEVFSEPVSTPCGHNFCRRCISQVWDTDGPCTCPLCKEVFHSRPQLKVNTLLKEVVSGCNLEKNKSRSMEDMPLFKEVQCDVCSEPKLKALKSCLVCLSSFCESHLQPHLTVSGLKRHQLMEPVENLEDRMCPTHQRPLELFCATDEKSVCMMCSVLEHKNHEFLSLEEACERRRSSLLQTQAQSQHMVEQRRQKIQEIQSLLELSETEALRERAVGLQAFTALMQSVQRRMDLFLEELQEKQSRSHRRAQDLVRRLEQEICDLEQSGAEAERLSRSHDPLHFLQRCPALTPPAGLKEWSSVSFEPETCEGSVTRALSELENSLSQEFKELPLRSELLRVQQCAVEVTLDPDTAHPNLALSEDLKQVHHTGVWKQLPDSPLSMDSTTSGPKPRKERSHRAQNSTSKSARVQKRREGARGREEEEKREEKEEVKRATVVDMDSVRREEEQENAGDLEITTGQDDGLKRRSLGALEWALMVFVLSLVLLFLPVSIWFCVRVVREHERAVVFRLGHLLRGKPRGPGLLFFLPFLDVCHIVDIRLKTLKIPLHTEEDRADHSRSSLCSYQEID